MPRFAYLSKARGRVRHGSCALDGLEDGAVLLLDGVVPHPVLGLVTRRVQRHLLPHPATMSRVVSSANSIQQLAIVRSTTILQTGESAFNECFALWRECVQRLFLQKPRLHNSGWHKGNIDKVG